MREKDLIYLLHHKKYNYEYHCEQITREIMLQIISASFSSAHKKLEILENTRILLEVLKHFIRTEHELKIIDEKTYIRIEKLIIETSKMTNGWIKYIQNLPQQKIPA
jgi:hypothetical protein